MSDDDIEFLDEDADIVQQCVHSIQPQLLEPKLEPAEEAEEEEPPAYFIHKSQKSQTPLLIERLGHSATTPPAKRRKKEEDDVDYDPIVDSPYRNRRRRHYRSKLSSATQLEIANRSLQSQSTSANKNINKASLKKPALSFKHINRRNMTIKIPDFDDPLCLPVRALVKDDSDSRRLRHWNHLCLEQFKKNDTPLRPNTVPVSTSKRTVVIRNLFNKYSGKTETTFWSKISVQSKEGGNRSEMVQAVLPRYREKKILNAYKLKEAKQRPKPHRYEVILTKEKCGDEETLVAYKPDESLSMVFKMFEREATDSSEDDKRYLQEIASCTACARCYQTSWRGNEVTDTREIVRAKCPVCARECLSAPALVTHVKKHAREHVALYRREISLELAKMLPYHYECRVCQARFPGIRELRVHLPEHAGLGEFYCEAGGHAVA